MVKFVWGIDVKAMMHTGWAPTTFVSSRAERNKQSSLRPEDFMDDEDKQVDADGT
jgi:G patch domain-containing protein 1